MKALSKFLSLILRHKPDIIGISLDEHGWADVEALLRGIQKSGRNIDASLLEKVVAENDKQRFSFSEDRKRVRANQGHSLQVDVELVLGKPPAVLYHGTVERNRASIEEKGLLRGTRLYVHLSEDDTAAGRKALLKKVEEEVAAGHVNVSDAEAVKNDILKGEPEQASSKLQYGDIERLVLVA